MDKAKDTIVVKMPGTRKLSETVRKSSQQKNDQLDDIRKPTATDESKVRKSPAVRKPPAIDNTKIRKPPATDRKSPDEQEYRPIGIYKSGRVRKSLNHFDQATDSAFLTHKEQSDLDLAIKLRAEGKITTSGKPFEALIKEELNALRALGVFKVVRFNPQRHSNIRIFNSRFVNKVKGKTTTLYKKSRLVIQAYRDNRKAVILIQSLTIQRSSQCLLITLTLSLFQIPGKRIQIFLRNII
jgi:hypothetical protein